MDFANKPPILAVINEYFPEVNLKIRGKKGVGLCCFHHEKTPSFHVYIEQNRFHCFSCKQSGDSLDLLTYATGKPLVDILHEHGAIVPSDKISQHKRSMEVQKYFTEQVHCCWLRLAKIHRDTYTLENKCKSIPTDDNLSLLADAFFVKNITSRLLDKLESKNSAEVKKGLNEAQERGLYSG